MDELLINWDVEPKRVGTIADRRPRVLHLITSFEVGGTERQAVALLRRLNRERYDVRVAVLHRRGPLLDQISADYPAVPEFPLKSFYDVNAVRQLGRLHRLIGRERVDLLHSHDFYAGLFGGVAARLGGAKVLAAQRHLRLSERRDHEWGSRLIQRLADRILVNSEAVRSHILESGRVRASKIVVVRNGLDECLTAQESRRDALIDELGLTPDILVVGMVARLEPVKGHRFLLAAAAYLANVEPRAHFVLVGGGSLRNEIETKIVELGLAGRVHLLGERADAAQLVSGFDVAVLASLHEGMPNAVMEAMASGVPVVATEVGGTSELIRNGETGYLVPPADADALTTCLGHAIAHPHERAAIGARGKQFVLAEFGMARMVAEVECLYDEMTRGRRR